MPSKRNLAIKVFRSGYELDRIPQMLGLKKSTIKAYCSKEIREEKRRRREALFESIIQGWSVDVVAEAFNLSVMTVKNYLYRVKRETERLRNTASEAFGWSEEFLENLRRTHTKEKKKGNDILEKLRQVMCTKPLVSYRELISTLGTSSSVIKRASRTLGYRTVKLLTTGNRYKFKEIYRVERGGYVYDPNSEELPFYVARLYLPAKEFYHRNSIYRNIKALFGEEVARKVMDIMRRCELEEK